MVSPTESSILAETFNRGLIPEETVVAAGPGNAQVTYYRPFWRPVFAGTLFALTVFVFSWFLMLGCHVGIDSAGNVAPGAGAAVWLWVTACIAFFFGGVIASAMTAGTSYGSAWLKGAVIWGLSIPLALVIYGFVAQSSGVLTAINLPHVGMTTAAPGGAHFGFYWSAFIGLACALVFSIIGTIVSCAACARGRRT